MKLRFEVDQAESFRQGVDCPKSVVYVDVNPSKLPQEERNLIADRMTGIDVMQMEAMRERVPVDEAQLEAAESDDQKTMIMLEATKPNGKIGKSHTRIKSKLPTFESLMEAIQENDNEVWEQAATADKS